jgi:hypothetical protein
MPTATEAVVNLRWTHEPALVGDAAQRPLGGRLAGPGLLTRAVLITIGGLSHDHHQRSHRSVHRDPHLTVHLRSILAAGLRLFGRWRQGLVMCIGGGLLVR